MAGSWNVFVIWRALGNENQMSVERFAGMDIVSSNGRNKMPDIIYTPMPDENIRGDAWEREEVAVLKSSGVSGASNFSYEDSFEMHGNHFMIALQFSCRMVIMLNTHRT